jgi:hypothetical protein
MSSADRSSADDAAYVSTAIEVALTGIRELVEEGLGELVGWQQRVDGAGIYPGTYLQIDFASSLHAQQIVRYERRILSADGPDKDAELTGMIFSTDFEERLRTHETETIVDAHGNRYLTIV